MSTDEPVDQTAEEKKRTERFDVYVQWDRGKPHQFEETVRASDLNTALMLGKRNVEFRREPVSLRVVPRQVTITTKFDDPTLSTSTDRQYRNVDVYFTTEVDADDPSLNATVDSNSGGDDE